MKTVIARRDKNIFYFFLFCVLGTLLLNGHNFVKFLSSDLRWFGIFSFVCLGIIVLVSLFGLFVLPNVVIEREDDTLILYEGAFRKRTFAWKDILSVEVLPAQNKEKESKNGSIVLKIKTENGEESISVHQIKDKKTVVETLNNAL